MSISIKKKKRNKQPILDMDIPKLYTRRMIKEYQAAFDLVVNYIQGGGGSTLAIIQSRQYAVELIRRTGMPICFYDTGTFDLETFFTQARDWTLASLDICHASGQEKFTALIWSAPEKEQLNSLVQAIQTLSRPSARLVVITPGCLNRFLPVNQRLTSPTGKLATTTEISRSLSQSGWALHTRCGLHGTRSMLYSLAARLQRLGRPDWHDRLISPRAASTRKQACCGRSQR
jgi:hypothetical protein